MTTLVLGATGFVGSALVPELVACGERVRGTSRRETPPGGAAGVEWFRCDVQKPDTLAAALEGVDFVYYLVHSMGLGAGDFRPVDREAAGNLARAAESAGCKRIVYLGGVAPRGRPSEHLASRIEVGEILRAGRVPTLELRAAMIVGNGSASWRILRDLSVRLPVMILPRWLESRSCPIALPDVITALLDGRHVPLEKSAYYDIAGPEALSCREMIQIVAAERGRHIPMLRVPVLSPRLSALWLRFVTSADREVARQLVLGLTQDLLPEGRSYWELSGHPPQWSFARAAGHALATERGPAKDGLWRAAR